MEILQTLKFIQGAVAKKDFVPVLTHVNIKAGTIQAYNGMVMLSSPIELNLDCSPEALTFIKAIQTCKESIQMHMTPGGKLSIKSGKFKTLVPCSTDEFPNASPAGERIELPGEGFIPALKRLEPFIAEDASRPWARGILFTGRTANATNNIILAQLWLPFSFPIAVNLPHAAVNELIRIKEEPIEMLVEENQITFMYEGGRWLRTQLYSTKWPDIEALYAKVHPGAHDIPEGFFDALREVRPFVDSIERVYLKHGVVATSAEPELATTSEVDDLQSNSIYNVEMLLMLEGVADKFNFAAWPAPAMFYGDNIRGCVVGIKL